MQAGDSQSWLGRNWGYAVAVVLAVAVYLPALGGELIWDDVLVFEQHLPAFRSLGDIFAPPDGIHEWGAYYYRPFVTGSYLLDSNLFGVEHFHGHHLTVILYHALAALAVGLLTQRLIGDGKVARWSGFAAAGWFAVHPLHVDSVAQITGRCDPMAAAFMLWSLLVLLRASGRSATLWPWIASALLLLGALFSKEVAVATVPIGALLLWLGDAVNKKVWMRFAAAFGATCAVYLVLRLGAGVSAAPPLDLSLGEAGTRLLHGLGYHVVMSFVPWRQAAFVPIELTPPWWVGMLALVAIITAGLAVWRGRSARPVLLVAWVWFIVTLLPVLALLLVSASEQPVAERYLYVPSVGISLMVGWLVSIAATSPIRTRVTTAVFAGLLTICCAATVVRSQIYRDAQTFWEDAVAKAPDAALPLYELGITCRKAGRLDEAMGYLEHALERYDDPEGRGLAHNTIGTIHLERQQLDEAEEAFRMAIGERPGYATPYFNLASVHGMRASRSPGATDLGALERAASALASAIDLRPTYSKARLMQARCLVQLAQAYRDLGQRDSAERALRGARAASQWLVRFDRRHGDEAKKMLAAIRNMSR